MVFLTNELVTPGAVPVSVKPYIAITSPGVTLTGPLVRGNVTGKVGALLDVAAAMISPVVTLRSRPERSPPVVVPIEQVNSILLTPGGTTN